MTPVQVDSPTILPPHKSVIEIFEENHDMDIMLEEIIHVFVKIYSVIVLSKTMSNFSV